MPRPKSDPRPRQGWCIITARFHAAVTERLLDGARACLRGHGIREEEIEVLHVAGAFEVPQAAAALARANGRGGPPMGIVALAVVVQGETPHFDYICAEVARALMSVALETGVPMGFGVLTCATLPQALARAGGDGGNKGWDAAEAAWDLSETLVRRDARELGARPGDSPAGPATN